MPETKSIDQIIGETFDDVNLVHSTTLIVKEVISNIRLLTDDADVLNYLEEVESNLSLLTGSALANTDRHALVEPAIAQAVAGIAAEQSVVEKPNMDTPAPEPEPTPKPWEAPAVDPAV